MATKKKAIDPEDARLDAVYAKLGAARAKAVERDSRICFGITWFATEADANAYAALVREAGITYNGGWLDGLACGRDASFDRYWTTKHPGRTLYAVTD